MENNLTIEWWDIDRPIDYARNARKITDDDVAKMSSLIKEYGWKGFVLVDPGGVIIAGHLRRRGGKAAGKTTCPVVVAHDLTKAQIKAFRLADNRMAVQVKTDYELLGLELGELKEMDFDLSLTAFNQFEIDPLLAAEWRPPSGGIEDDEPIGKPEKEPKLGIEFTSTQFESVGRGILAIRSDRKNNKLTDGECVKMLAENYLSSSKYNLEDAA